MSQTLILADNDKYRIQANSLDSMGNSDATVQQVKPSGSNMTKFLITGALTGLIGMSVLSGSSQQLGSLTRITAPILHDLGRNASQSKPRAGTEKDNEKFFVFSMSHTQQLAYNVPIEINDKTEETTMPLLIQKLTKSRDVFERVAGSTGVALTGATIALPIFTSISWGAALPSAILSLSLVAFIFMRRLKRR